MLCCRSQTTAEASRQTQLGRHAGPKRKGGRLTFLLVSGVFLAVTELCAVSAQWFDCQQLEEDSWEEFVSVINRDPEFAVFCPFHIHGKKCDDIPELGYEVPPGVETYIMCDDHYSKKECIIDCPGRHFTVGSGGRLTIDRITLRGANKSSVRVEAGGELTTWSVQFQRNTNSGGRGGAIDAGPETVLRLQGGQFVRNRAQSGGAVNYLGRAEFHEVTFEQNFAESYNGGAIFAGIPDDLFIHSNEGHTSFIGRNTFVGNYAKNYGPAFFNEREELSQNSNRFGVTHSGVNVGCRNHNRYKVECNGIFEFKSAKCEPFEIECNRDVEETGAPTIGPTASPVRSNQPTMSPSWNPSEEPSTEPTSHPSSVPSLRPTASPTLLPSVEPTNLPSSVPSLRSTASPTLLPSVEPTNLPSSVPSARPTTPPTVGPSVEPRNLPTEQPSSAGPTTAPTEDETTSPTNGPTVEKTTPPSKTPSLRPSQSKTRAPTRIPSTEPSYFPTSSPSNLPTGKIISPPVVSTLSVSPQSTSKTPKGKDKVDKKGEKGDKGDKEDKGDHSRRRQLRHMNGR